MKHGLPTLQMGSPNFFLLVLEDITSLYGQLTAIVSTTFQLLRTALWKQPFWRPSSTFLDVEGLKYKSVADLAGQFPETMLQTRAQACVQTKQGVQVQEILTFESIICNDVLLSMCMLCCGISRHHLDTVMPASSGASSSNASACASCSCPSRSKNKLMRLTSSRCCRALGNHDSPLTAW